MVLEVNEKLEIHKCLGKVEKLIERAKDKEHVHVVLTNAWMEIINLLSTEVTGNAIQERSTEKVSVAKTSRSSKKVE